ncbi:queuine tRNA-ribosyltransferase [Culex quinquefasciatus]|uniref:Queuine tRNA-ribosyltransferase accessory subunit 2 n=1 Tax=Culex quinquefasciatus TaxID=7176 RepID=QTRT2_CULQU|nr:RecName: Full=Queuine tRNA-ribosyltransferase accessory subunit 2; AltName: Full=Queuine tRNA-ribosyltransferase domain-containing protein 1 [Culex quinquefasciatus]EDS41584.1 queuine tRNA-ribosyltransferase [Culex quinquefasciatus]|eukprot:XP_001845764.1 queuine tRNA-ribosyltransferase [Culex quinquefasciatus]
MKFVLETVSKCSGRLGSLSGVDRLASSAKFQTPTLVLHTKGGSVPHLSKEVLHYLTGAEPQLMQYSLNGTVHMEEAVRGCGDGLSGFVAQKESVSLLVLRDPAEPCQPGYHEKDVVPVFGRSGRKNFTAESYMSLVEAFRPDVYVPLFDGDTDGGSSKKREQRSQERTETFVEQCLEVHRKSEKLKGASVLGPIVGGYNKKLREKSVQFVERLKDDFAGYFIAGLHSYGSSASEVKEAPLLDIVSSVCQQLPLEKPKFLFGAFTPQLVLELVVRGVDIFDTSYPYLKTQQNRALNFSFDTSDSNVVARKNELDLTDACWAEDFTGFVDGCQCLACTKHTKAYTHHLYNTREMLAPILLMIHNLHHYFEFFKAIRRHVAQDTVGELIAHINKHVVLPVTDGVVKEPGKSLDGVELKESASVQVEAKRVKV